MARFVDLDEEPDAAHVAVWPATSGTDAVAPAVPLDHAEPKDPEGFRRVVPMSRAQAAMTEAIACYPIVVAIAAHIDLNTLDALARVSRGVHNGLIQYRSVLLNSTLHCAREAVPVNPDAVLRYRARAADWHYMDDGRSGSGKASRCARDMVQACRRCGDVVCRNCAIKPPASVAARERHRRLCVTCSRAPLTTLLSPPLEARSPLGFEAAAQGVCLCQTGGVWLCQPCGRGIRNADCEYRKIWHWRTHYGEILGGLGTGIGDGDRGVICGRETHCLAAREIEQQVDCDAEDARSSTPGGPSPTSAASSPEATSITAGVDYVMSAATAPPPPQPHPDGAWHDSERPPSLQLGPGYERHEIEGIGGRVKRKLVRMVRVGACVPEEVDGASFNSHLLGPEARGEARSFCGWCQRVIPGHRDMATLGVDA